MHVIADLHIHSKYSRATSASMVLTEVSRFAKAKGLDLVGTGDFTHPLWFKCISGSLVEAESGTYRLLDQPDSNVRFVVQGEVCTIFESHGKSRRIHHVILCPSLDGAEQVNDRLKRFGDLALDGRPILQMSAAELVEEVTAADLKCFVFPAHIWTPWFSALGSVGGFDSIDDCYMDQRDKIHAVETGLSSDPPMNWRISSLDRYAVISFSDAHSAWPWRLGREATILDLDELSYGAIARALCSRRTSGIFSTIETDPAYGKYHWSGHRRCAFSISGVDAIKVKGRCPKCGRRLTKGVEERVEEIADRPPEFVPNFGCTDFVHLLPLHEVIAAAKSLTASSKSVWSIYNALVARFGSEYTTMLTADREDLCHVVDPDVAEAIVRVREGGVYVAPGYDGVYGAIDLRREKEAQVQPSHVRRQRLEDFV